MVRLGHRSTRYQVHEGRTTSWASTRSPRRCGQYRAEARPVTPAGSTLPRLAAELPYTVLHDDEDKPQEIRFWGTSGD